MGSILIVRTGSAPEEIVRERGDFHHWFAAFMPAGVDVETLNLPAGERLPDSVVGLSGLILTGSPAMVTDRLDWSLALEDWLRRHRRVLPPTLAVCYGHQVLASAFGGKVATNPGGRIIGTRVSVRLAEDALFSQLPEHFPVQKSHCQQVLEPPSGAVALAASVHDPHTAFRLDEHIWSLQFHPEFSAEVTRSYIEVRSEDIRREGLDPKALMTSVQPCDEAENLLQRFGRLCLG